jgi:hypothetical protein
MPIAPFAFAVQDVLSRWADADADYEQAADYLRYTQDQLTIAEADPDIDPLDVESAHAAVKLATLALPDTPPAQHFHRELTEVMAERAEAAGGADRIVTEEHLESARKQAIADDTAAVAAARAHRDRLYADLDRAESATASAFAEAETRTAEYVLDHIDELRTELAMLRAAGDYRIERAIHIDPDAVRHLPDLTARGINNLARSGFTVNAVHVGDPHAAREALALMRAAALEEDRMIMWCRPIDRHSALPVDHDDLILSLADVHRQITRGEREIDSTTTIVIDNSRLADPSVLTDIAEHAANHQGRVILLDDGRGWPRAPSGPLLKLLHRDLPWSTTLSVDATTPARRAAQPDLDPLLDRAGECEPEHLFAEVNQALADRALLRRQHLSSDRVAARLWSAGTARSNTQASGVEL